MTVEGTASGPAEIVPPPPDRRTFYREMQDAFYSFIGTIESLSLLATVAPNALSEELATQNYRALMRALEDERPSEGKDRVIAAFQRVHEAGQSAAIAGAKPKEVPPELFEATRAEFLDALRESSWDDFPLPRFYNHILRADQRPNPSTLILNATLVTAVSTLDGTLGRAAYWQLKMNPKATADGKEFSIADVIEHGSIARLIDISIERKVDSLLRGDITSWNKWWQEKSGLRLSLAAASLDWHEIQEIYKRRHAIVHTEAKVNTDYAQTVTGSDPVGSPLAIDPGYLRSALEQVLTLGASTLLAVWLAWTPEKDGACAVARIAAHELQVQGLDRAAARIFGLAGKHVSKEQRLQTQLEEWRALVRSGAREQPERVISENVVATNTDQRYVIAALLALGRVDEAFAILENVLMGGRLTLAAVKMEDAFRELVQDERFERLASSVEASE
jgi:hypothetical protein